MALSPGLSATAPALPSPKRGEVWRVQLEPVRGSEQGKTRPVVVLSQPPTGRPTMRLCAPIMNRLPVHGAFFWCVALEPTQGRGLSEGNGLTKDSTVDAAQVRALDLVRFESRLGSVTDEEIEAIAAALYECVK